MAEVVKETPPASILVVDDDEVIRRMTYHVLEREQYQVIKAENGHQALALYKECQPDIVLLDAIMPVMDGFEACARLRQLPDADYVSILIMTALNDAESVDRAFEAGATDFITKPIHWAVLRRRLAHMIQTRRTQTQLRAVEAHMQAVVSQALDGIATFSSAGVVTSFNPAAERIFGYKSSEIVGQNIQTLFDPVSRSRVFQPESQQEMIGRPRNGGTVPLELSISQYEAHGQKLFVAIMRDITERRQAEEEIKTRARQQAAVAELGQRALVTSDMASLMDETVKLLAQTLDIQYCKILKYAPDDETLQLVAGVGWRNGGVGWTKVSAGTDSQAGYTLLARSPVIVENTQTETRFRIPQLLIDHAVISGISIAIQGGENGQPFGVLSAHTTIQRKFTEDDTHFLYAVANVLAQAIERERAREALEAEKVLLEQRVAARTADLTEANLELAQANRHKDEFLANMSHELRTPLNSILGMSEVLRDDIYGPLNEKQHKAISIIEDGGRHLLSLINDILDLAKIEAGKLKLEIGFVTPENVCQASLYFIKQFAAKKQVKTNLSLDQNLSVIQTDERRLKQMLVNLLSNAVKFTTEGGEVGLEVKNDATEDVVHFTVWDTGIGIAEEDRPKLFKPFVQVDSSLSRSHEGTGLGLSLVARLAEMLGGRVSVESEVGQGSNFTISLPRQSTDLERKIKSKKTQLTTEKDVAI